MNRLFLLLVAAGMCVGFAACGDDNDDLIPVEKPTTPNDKPGSPIVIDDPVEEVVVKHEMHITDTGFVGYSEEEGSWYIEALYGMWGDRIDGGVLYMTNNLPEAYQVKGMKVRVSGDLYEYQHKQDEHGGITVMAGYEYYLIDIKQIAEEE